MMMILMINIVCLLICLFVEREHSGILQTVKFLEWFLLCIGNNIFIFLNLFFI